MIQRKMTLAGVRNLSEYLRKTSIDGYVVRLDIPELRELLTNVRRAGGNLNQLTKRVNETGRFYEADMEDLRQTYEKLQAAADGIFDKLSRLA